MSQEGNNDNETDSDGKTDIDVRYLMSRLFSSDSNDCFWIEPTLSSIFTDSRLDSLMKEFNSLSEFQLAKALLALSQLSTRRVSECSTMIEGIFNHALAAADSKEREVHDKPDKVKQRSRKRNAQGESKNNCNEEKRRDAAPSWVPVLASILHTKNEMCTLTTDIGITDPSFKSITDELVGLKRENNIERTFPHLQYLTDINPAWVSKDKSKPLLNRRQSKLDNLRANLLEKWSNANEKEGERRRISVPKKMRSFMKTYDDAKPLPKGITQRSNSIPGKCKSSALEKSLNTRLPGAQISRPINKQVGIKLLDFSEQPGVGKFARQKRQREIQEEKERKRKEREEKEAEAKAASKQAREAEKIQRNAAAVAEREAQERAAVRRAKDIEETKSRLQLQHQHVDEERLAESPTAVMSGVATNEDYDDLHHVLMADEQIAKKKRELEMERSMRLQSPGRIQSVGQTHFNSTQQDTHTISTQIHPVQTINNQATAASQLLFSPSIDTPQSSNQTSVAQQAQVYRPSQVHVQNIQQGGRQTVVHLMPSSSTQQDTSHLKEQSQQQTIQQQVHQQLHQNAQVLQKSQPTSNQRTNQAFISVPINSGITNFSRISNTQVETNKADITPSQSNQTVVGPMHVISTPQGLQLLQAPVSQQEVAARPVMKRQAVSQERPVLQDTVGGTQIQNKTQGLTVIQPQTKKVPQQQQQQQQTQQQPQQILNQKANIIPVNNSNVTQQPILLLNNGRMASLASNSHGSIIALRGLPGSSGENQLTQLPGHRFIITNSNSNVELQPIAPRPTNQDANVRPAPQIITVGQQRFQQQTQQQVQQQLNQRRQRQQTQISAQQIQQTQIQQSTSQQHVPQQQSVQSHLDASKQQLTTTMVSDEQGQRLLLKTVALQNSGDTSTGGLVIRPMQQVAQSSSNQQSLALDALSRVQTQQLSQQQPVRLAPISSLRNPAPQAQSIHILTPEQAQEVQQTQRIILTPEQLQAAIRSDSSINVSQQPATQPQVPAGLPASLMGSADGSRQGWS